MCTTQCVLPGLIVGLTLAACGPDETADDYKDYELLDIGVCAPDAGPFSLTIDNPFHPLAVGDVVVLKGGGVKVQITVLDETRTLAGVETRAVEEREWEDGELVEVSVNYFAQAPDGTVCYFGEEVDDYKNGKIAGHGGAWLAGDGNNVPGIIMPGLIRTGVKFRQESAPGVAEDMSAITELGKKIATPAGEFTDTLRAFDWNPLEGKSGDVKFYVRDIGLAVDEDARLVSY